MSLRVTAIFSLLMGLGVAAHADVKTTYSIDGNGAQVTSAIHKASADSEKMMKDFLFPTIAKKLRELPMVTSIEFNAKTKGKKSTSTYQDYWEVSREFPAMVHLALPTPVTLMVRVNETYRRCKSPAEKQNGVTGTAIYDDYDGYSAGPTVDCDLDSATTIKGPYEVYGNFASSVDLVKLLKERQTIGFDVSRDYSDKTTMNVVSRFHIESELFDRGILKFLNVMNVPLEKSDDEPLTRNRLLLGVARILRVNNERMVEQ